MPSHTKSWVTEHDELSLLHITSDDPRRGGRIELAYFDTAIVGSIQCLNWCIRRNEPYCQEIGTSLANYCAKLYGKGIFRYEPGCDYTSSNYYQSILDKQQFKDKVVSKQKNFRLQDLFHAPMRYKHKSDFIELEVRVQCKRTITIKINNSHVRFVPKKLFVSRTTGELCLWPKREPGRKFKKFSKFSVYLLNKVNPSVNPHAHRRTGIDRLDYRIREDESGFINSATQYIKKHEIAEGIVIEVGFVEGACKDIWIDTGVAYRYPQGTLLPGAERRAYVLVKDATPFIDAYIQYDNGSFLCETLSGKQSTIERICAHHANMQIENIMIPSRNTKGYDKAIERGDLTRRARYENKIISEQTTNGRMFTAPKFIKRRRVYADTTTEVTLPDGSKVFALDCRPDHLIIGGKGRTKNLESKPLTAHELQTLSALNHPHIPREDI